MITKKKPSTSWWETLPVWSKTMVTFVPAITAIVSAYLYIGLPMPASQEYVHHQVWPLKMAQSQVQRSVDSLLKNQLIQEQLTYQRDPKTMANPAVQGRLRQIEGDLQAVDQRLNQPPTTPPASR